MEFATEALDLIPPIESAISSESVPALSESLPSTSTSTPLNPQASTPFVESAKSVDSFDSTYSSAQKPLDVPTSGNNAVPTLSSLAQKANSPPSLSALSSKALPPLSAVPNTAPTSISKSNVSVSSPSPMVPTSSTSPSSSSVQVSKNNLPAIISKSNPWPIQTAASNLFYPRNTPLSTDRTGFGGNVNGFSSQMMNMMMGPRLNLSPTVNFGSSSSSQSNTQVSRPGSQVSY